MKKLKVSRLRIAYTGGGTGGHRLPIIAIRQALQPRVENLEELYIGEADDCRSADIKKLGVKSRAVAAGKWRRYLSLKNLTDIFRVVAGFGQAKRILNDFKPDVLFSKGGYVSVPVVRAASSLGIPIITHESDIVMGIANRLNSRRATKVCTAYPIEHYRSLPKEKLYYTGNLIRAELVAAAKTPTEPKFKVGGRTVFMDNPLLVVLGGSQGAHRINELFSALLPLLLPGFKVIHSTGAGDIEWLQQKRAQLGEREQRAYLPVPSLGVTELGNALAAATLVVSRAGSMISELALFAKPTILIPLSTSAGGHQLRNAKVFEAKGAALVLNESNLTPPKLWQTIKRLFMDAKLQARLKKGMRQMQEPNGADRVARLLIKYGQK